MIFILVLSAYILSLVEAVRVLHEKKTSAAQWVFLALLNIAVFSLGYWSYQEGVKADAWGTQSSQTGLLIFGFLGLAALIYHVYLFLGDNDKD